IDDQTVNENNAITPIVVNAEDDGEVTVEVSELPEGVSFNPDTNEISGTPIVDDGGETEETRDFPVTVTVTDEDGNVSAISQVTVTDKDQTAAATNTVDQNNNGQDDSKVESLPDTGEANDGKTGIFAVFLAALGTVFAFRRRKDQEKDK